MLHDHNHTDDRSPVAYSSTLLCQLANPSDNIMLFHFNLLWRQRGGNSNHSTLLTTFNNHAWSTISNTGPWARMQVPHLCLVLATLARGKEVTAHRCGHLACKFHCERASASSAPHRHSLATQQQNERLVGGGGGGGGHRKKCHKQVPLEITQRDQLKRCIASQCIIQYK